MEGHCPGRKFLVMKGHQWGRYIGTWLTGRTRSTWRGREGSPLLNACSSVPSACLLPTPALGRGHMGTERRAYPQDPVKVRWLAGSSALLSGLLLFLLLPPLLFSHMEGWNYMEGFYFAFVTLSTVGFGDYVIGERSQRAGRGRGGGNQRLRCLALHLSAPIAVSTDTCCISVPSGAWRPKFQRTGSLAVSTRLCYMTRLIRSPSQKVATGV